jgi:hypothetical protein
MIAETKFRRLNAPELLKEVADGKKFVDGVAAGKSSSNGKGRLAA